jgi:hypothetical protein
VGKAKWAVVGRLVGALVVRAPALLLVDEGRSFAALRNQSKPNGCFGSAKAEKRPCNLNAIVFLTEVQRNFLPGNKRMFCFGVISLLRVVCGLWFCRLVWHVGARCEPKVASASRKPSTSTSTPPQPLLYTLDLNLPPPHLTSQLVARDSSWVPAWCLVF